MPRAAGWDTAPRHQVGTSNTFSPSNHNSLSNHVTGRSQSQGDALALIRSANLKITRQLNSRAAAHNNQVRPSFNNTQVRPNFNTQVRPNFNTQVRPNTNFNSWKKPSSSLVSAKPHNGGFVYTNALTSQWPASVEDDNLSAGSDSDSQGSIICVSDGPSTVRKHTSSHSHNNHRQGNHQPDMYKAANKPHNFSNARQSSLDGAMDSHRPVTGGVWNPSPAPQHRAESSGWSTGQGQGPEVTRPEEGEGEASLAPGDVRLMTAMWEKQGGGESGDREGRQRPFTASVHTSGDRPSSAIPSIQAQFNAWKQSQAPSDPWVKSGQPAKSKPGPATVYGQASPTRTTFGPQASLTRAGYSQGSPTRTNHGPQGSPTRTTFGNQASPTRSTFASQASPNRAGYASQGSPTRGPHGLSKPHYGPQTSYGPSQASHGPSQGGHGPSQSGHGPSQNNYGPQSSYGPPQVSPKPNLSTARPGYGGRGGGGVSGYMSESGIGGWQDSPGKADFGWSSSSRALFSPPSVQHEPDYKSLDSTGEEQQAQYKSTATLFSKPTPATSAPATGTKLTVRPSSASSATNTNTSSNTASWKPRPVLQPSDTNSLSWKPQSRPSQQLADFRKGVGSDDGEDKKIDTTKGGVPDAAELGSRSSSNDTLSNLVAANRDDVPSSGGNNKRLMELIEKARDTERELADGGDDSGRPASPHVAAADKLLSPTGKTSSWSGAISNMSSTRSGLPQSQNPTITLLQKNRVQRVQKQVLGPALSTSHEGGLSKGAQYMDIVDAIESNKKQLEQFDVNSVSSHAPVTPAATSVLQDRGPLSITMTSMERARPHTAPSSGRTLQPINTDGATLTSSKTRQPADSTTLTSSHDDVTEGSKDSERKPIKYVGIGPMDKETGMPVGLRMNVDDNLRRDWYRQMYKTLHHAPEKPELLGALALNTDPPPQLSESDDWGSKVDLEEMIKSADVSLKELSEILNMTPEEVKTKMIESDWTPASAKYRPQVYKNQPQSISDYEPGKSSLARNEHLQSELYNPPVHSPAQHSKYTVKKPDVTLHKTSQGGSGGGVGADLHDIYKRLQKGEHDIPLSGLRGLTPERTHTPSGRRSSQPPDAVSPVPLMSAANEHSWGSLDRTKRDELSRQRHAEVERLIEREKRKKWDEEMKANEARRHNDFTLPQQKSPIPIDRFEDVVTSSHLTLPVNKGRIVTRGKASALYTFRAKGPRELSMRKGDIIYLLRDVDKNWFEAEHHGCVGIVPKSYVSVLTSIEQAHTSAGEREGQATAKFNFVPRTNAELPLKKGDVVKLIRRIDDNWYEGRLGHKQGIFPVSYVEVGQEPRTPLTTPVPSCAPTPVFGSAGRLSPVGSVCSGIAPTIPSVPASPAPLDWDDLDPQKYMRPWLSQSVPSVSQASDKPHTFSNGLKAASQQLATPKAKYPVYKAMFRYEAQNADELCLQEGDVVQVVEKCDDGWYVGLSERTHDFGTFPGNYVQPVM